ncbi:MAG: hypothetical protein AAGD40_02260 [Pseudomonadota bacterium]
MKDSSLVRRGTAGLAWATALAALAILVIARGWELGIPLWLAAFAMAGVASLLVTALAKRWHLTSAAIAAIVAAFAIVVSLGPGSAA